MDKASTDRLAKKMNKFIASSKIKKMVSTDIQNKFKENLDMVIKYEETIVYNDDLFAVAEVKKAIGKPAMAEFNKLVDEFLAHKVEPGKEDVEKFTAYSLIMMTIGYIKILEVLMVCSNTQMNADEVGFTRKSFEGIISMFEMVQKPLTDLLAKSPTPVDNRYVELGIKRLLKVTEEVA